MCCALSPACLLQMFQELPETSLKETSSASLLQQRYCENSNLSAASLRRLTRSFTKGASGEACKPAGGWGSRVLCGADRIMHWSLLMISLSRSKLTRRAFSLTKMHVGKELATCNILAKLRLPRIKHTVIKWSSLIKQAAMKDSSMIRRGNSIR